MKLEEKRILITGGAGFIGSCLVSQLIANNKVTIFDNFYRHDSLEKTPTQHPNLVVVKGDVQDTEAVASIVKDHNIVVHAAAIAGIDTVIKSPVRTMEVNLLGTMNVLRACLNLSNLERVLLFSTSEVFGRYAFRSDETHETVAGSAGEARWTYAVSKLAGEHLGHAYYSEYGLPVVTVRPFNVYGPGQVGEGALQIFVKKALRNEEIYIYGDGAQIRAWCYVDDMVDALLQCLENPAAVGQSFNIGNSRAVMTIHGLAQTVCRVLNSSSKIVFKPPLSADVELRVPNVNKAKEILGFEAKVDLEEGILHTGKWFSKSAELP